MAVKDDIMAEFKAMEECGMQVTKRAYQYLKDRDVEQYINMAASAAADLVIQLSDI